MYNHQGVYFSSYIYVQLYNNTFDYSILIALHHSRARWSRCQSSYPLRSFKLFHDDMKLIESTICVTKPREIAQGVPPK